jgi:hypothetical protein
MKLRKLLIKKTLALSIYRSVAKKRVYSESRFIVGERVLGL